MVDTSGLLDFDAPLDDIEEEKSLQSDDDDHNISK